MYAYRAKRQKKKNRRNERRYEREKERHRKFVSLAYLEEHRISILLSADLILTFCRLETRSFVLQV